MKEPVFVDALGKEHFEVGQFQVLIKNTCKTCGKTIDLYKQYCNKFCQRKRGSKNNKGEN